MRPINIHSQIGKLLCSIAALAMFNGCADQSTDVADKVVKSGVSICTDKGAKLSALGPHPVCVFEDNRQCSVEAVNEGRCIEYGYKITGYVTDALAYCAISGHHANEDQQQCELVNGTNCNVDAFWEGECK